MSNEDQIQEAFLALLDSALPEKVIEQAIPDADLVERDPVSGVILPYVAVQFGDLQQGRATSFCGPRGDDYILPIYVQALGPTPRIARRLANRVRDAILGNDVKFSGSVRKRAGGGMYPLVTSNGATEAYIMPASFGVLIQYS